jgi:hypothetical protein
MPGVAVLEMSPSTPLMGWTMPSRSIVLPAMVICAAVLAGCGGIQPTTKPMDTHDYTGTPSPHSIGNADASYADSPLFSFGHGSQQQDSGGALGVNAFLWRGALDTLSFMPLVSADPFGGVIITDWYQPQTDTSERFKATAYILGRQLRADGIRVQVFRQVQQGGQWVDAPVSATTSADIENKVLARARELRTQVAGP